MEASWAQIGHEPTARYSNLRPPFQRMKKVVNACSRVYLRTTQIQPLDYLSQLLSPMLIKKNEIGACGWNNKVMDIGNIIILEAECSGDAAPDDIVVDGPRDP